MEKIWEAAAKSLSNIKVTASSDNEPVRLEGTAKDFRCIGVGTDAAVFQSLTSPEFAFKVFAEGKQAKLHAEAEVYGRISSSFYFTRCYGVVGRILVLKYEEGLTLFDCLLQGIQISEQVIRDVEDARQYIRQIGLNPRDIHLKNILLQNGRAKLLDVSEYIKPGNDYRWEHLKKAYEEFYPIIDSKPVPFWLLETVRKWYHHWNHYSSSFEEFMGIVADQMNYKK